MCSVTMYNCIFNVFKGSSRYEYWIARNITLSLCPALLKIDLVIGYKMPRLIKAYDLPPSDPPPKLGAPKDGRPTSGR